ncbi:hypothetical protein K458DRAFT_384886 [Lentithecium fluviatile CBS 122367]|uniref:Uncharacterized protein n=1 Tax=Lentithecium fluviatile CBS 122367 TaxID=1168545 RepID=A0A6G1JDU3_9PLEO|nr:hypothetical protein K458DRAFT_384886 [Lentithecium fluviatile CBS 122367]
MRLELIASCAFIWYTLLEQTARLFPLVNAILDPLSGAIPGFICFFPTPKTRDTLHPSSPKQIRTIPTQHPQTLPLPHNPPRYRHPPPFIAPPTRPRHSFRITAPSPTRQRGPHNAPVLPRDAYGDGEAGSVQDVDGDAGTCEAEEGLQRGGEEGEGC